MAGSPDKTDNSLFLNARNNAFSKTAEIFRIEWNTKIMA